MYRHSPPDRPHLSVIIPAYNEERRVGITLDLFCAYLEDHGYDYEMLVVDDGSTDGTAEVVQARAQHNSRLRMIACARNRGKGAAVRRGMLSAGGELLLFSDADLSTPPTELPKLLEAIEQGYDLAIGSRGLPESDLRLRQSWYREYMGRTFNLLVRMIAVPGIHDTQCGFKVFRKGAAKELFRHQLLPGFAFDVEVLFLARRLGYRVKEVPVVWINSPRSSVRPLVDSIRMLRDLLKIRLCALAGRYRER